jgi:hypothetical protein
MITAPNKPARSRTTLLHKKSDELQTQFKATKEQKLTQERSIAGSLGGVEKEHQMLNIYNNISEVKKIVAGLSGLF